MNILMFTFKFTDLEYARNKLKSEYTGSGANICINKIIQDGFIKMYVIDEEHKNRIAEKYKAVVLGYNNL